MKTDDLVTVLATRAEPVEPHLTGRRYATALVAGMLCAALLMASLLGVRSDLAEAVMLPMFWVKLAFAACLAVASLLTVMRLSRPGMPLDGMREGLAAPVLVIWLLAGIVLVRAGSGQWSELLLGKTWKTCPYLIAMLSLPVFVAVLWAMKGLAPTRLRLAGAAAGLLAGATGAVVYCVHCPELEAPFIGIWYLLGMLVPTALGALIGPRLLRW
jgi:hypothetical protein